MIDRYEKTAALDSDVLLPETGDGISDSTGNTSMFDSLRLFRKLLSEEIFHERKILIAGFSIAFVTGCFTVMIPYLLQLIIDRAIPEKDPSLLLRYSVALAVVLSLSLGLWYVQASLMARASENIFRNFKMRLSEAILRKHLSFFSRYQSSDLLTRMVADLQLVSEFFHKYMLKSLVELVFILVLLVYIFFASWKLALIAVFGIPFLGIVMAGLEGPITRASASTRKRASEQNDRVLDILQGYREIRFFQQNETMLSHAKTVFDNFAEANFRFTRTMEITDHLLYIGGTIILISPIIVGGYAICRGGTDLTLGLLIAFQTYLLILAEGAQKISMGFAESIKAAPPITRLLEMIDYPVEEAPRTVDWNDIPDLVSIEFRQVAFGYFKNRKILNDFSLRIDPGEKVCLMGQSGTGKTTLANLLLRFIAPDAGEITLGGVNIQRFPLASYLSHFSYVWQDTYLFRLSVTDNVKLGWYRVPDAMVEEVIEQVGLKDVVESLPRKYDTVIGKDGINFSGGQKQRLALARALIRGPEILMLDEFTSALDSELEKKMLDDIFRLFRHQTIICITHSDRVAGRFDRVVRL